MSNIANRDQILSSSHKLSDDIGNLIEQARSHVASKYNSVQVLLNWTIGQKIDNDFLNTEHAQYGETIIEKISESLTLKYGRGYSRFNLLKMLKFSRIFPDKEIVATLSQQLSWSHLVIMCAIENNLKRGIFEN